MGPKSMVTRAKVKEMKWSKAAIWCISHCPQAVIANTETYIYFILQPLSKFELNTKYLSI